MNKIITLVFFAFVGISVVSGRIGFDPKTWSPNDSVDVELTAPPPPSPADKCDYCKMSIREIGNFVKERDYEEFMDVDVDIVADIVCEDICPLPKKKSWFRPFW
jgi:hypothetical protein